MQSDDDKLYIKEGRDATYKLIDILFNLEGWKHDKTLDFVKTYSMTVSSENDVKDLPKGTYIRAEAEFSDILLHQILEYFYRPHLRHQWMRNTFESLELVKELPLHT